MSENTAEPEEVRELGKKARATRRSLLEATARQLDGTPLHHLSVVDITREAGLSSASFYQYFDSLDSAVLSLLEELADSDSLQSSVADSIVTHGDTLPGTLTRSFMVMTHANRAVLAAAVACTVQGDQEFADLLDAVLRPVVDTLTAYVTRSIPAELESEIRSELAIEVRSALMTALMHGQRPGAGYEQHWDWQIRRMVALAESLKDVSAR